MSEKATNQALTGISLAVLNCQRQALNNFLLRR